jgi:hypothetical protein
LAFVIANCAAVVIHVDCLSILFIGFVFSEVLSLLICSHKLLTFAIGICIIYVMVFVNDEVVGQLVVLSILVDCLWLCNHFVYILGIAVVALAI